MRSAAAAGALCFAALLSAPAAPALAWDSEGHHIAAEIAVQFLEPQTAHQIRELLAIDNETTLAHSISPAEATQWRSGTPAAMASPGI